MSSELLVNIDGRKGTVDRSKYVKAKTCQLKEFGYVHLTEKDVDEQIDALIAGKKFGDGLTVIGMFMEGEVLGAVTAKVVAIAGGAKAK